VSVGAAKENLRIEVASVSVLAYFNELKDVPSISVRPDEILSMDETGISVRPIKGNQRNIGSLKRCTILPTFHEENDVSYVAFVTTITLGDQSLIPLMLTSHSRAGISLFFARLSELIVPPAAT
jgi:hypothetical protein